MLEINTNSLAYSVYTHLRKAEAQSTTAMERLSSGKRINSGMDDAAGLSISNRMNVLYRSIQTAIGNVNDGISMGQAQEAGIREIDSYLVRTKQLLVQAANDTLSTSAVSSIFNEIEQMMGGIAESIAVTKFNGLDLLGNRSVSSATTLGDVQVESIDGDYGVTASETLTLSTQGLTTDTEYQYLSAIGDTPTTVTPDGYYDIDGTSSSSYTTMADTDPMWDSSGQLYFKSTRDGSSEWYTTDSLSYSDIEYVQSAATNPTGLVTRKTSHVGSDSSYDVFLTSYSSYVRMQFRDSSGNSSYYNFSPPTDISYSSVQSSVNLSSQTKEITVGGQTHTAIDMAYSDGWDVFVTPLDLTTGSVVGT